MAIGDYIKTAYVNGTAPPLSAANLNNAENKIDELDDNVFNILQYPQSGFVSGRGWWQKHADGTLECWSINLAMPTHALGQDAYVLWTLPADRLVSDAEYFISYAPTYNALGDMAELGLLLYNGVWVGFTGSTSQIIRLYTYSYRSAITISYYFRAYFKGRWK